MRFTIAVSALAMAASVMAAPWKPLGGDLAYVGPVFNATFKAGDTIPLEYTFYSGKTVNLNSTTNATAPAAPIITGNFLNSTQSNQLWRRRSDNLCEKYKGGKTIDRSLYNTL